MRLIAWLFVVSAVLAAIGVFVPCLEVHIGGFAVRRASLSLYRANADRELARAMLGRYARAGQRLTGEKVADAVLEHAAGRARQLHVDDARDAMSALDSLDDHDVVVMARALSVTVWTLLALAALACLAGASTALGAMPTRTRRLAALIVLAVLLSAIAVAVHVGCRIAVWEAYDELGADALALASGAWLMPLAALGALGCAIALPVARRAEARGSGSAQRDAQRA